MTRLSVAVYGQLFGLLLSAVAVGLVVPAAGVVAAGAGLVWWFRYVFQVEVDE